MNKRLIEFDMLRGAAIIGVIAIHVTTAVITDHTSLSAFYLSLFLNQLSRFAVPAFLFLSGFGLNLKNRLEEGYLLFLKRRLSKIVLLYVLWSLVYHVYNNSALNIADFGNELITGGSHYHLYFVPLIILFYAMYPLLKKIGESTSGLAAALIITVSSQIVGRVFGVSQLVQPLNLLNWLIFFVMGIWFAKHFSSKVIRIKKYTHALVISVFIGIAVIFMESSRIIGSVGKSKATTSMRPSIIVLSVLVILLFISLSWKQKAVIKLLGKLSTHSFGIYLSHVLILIIFRHLFQLIGLYGSVIYLLSSIITVSMVSLLMTQAADTIIEKYKTEL